MLSALGRVLGSVRFRGRIRPWNLLKLLAVMVMVVRNLQVQRAYHLEMVWFRGRIRHWNLLKLLAVMVVVFFSIRIRRWNLLKLLAVMVVGSFSVVARATRWTHRCVPAEWLKEFQKVEPFDSTGDAWCCEEWGAYGPPEIARLDAMCVEDKSDYCLVGTEQPLQVGWDLLGEYVDALRMAVVQEEYAERDHLLRRGEEGEDGSGPLHRWLQDLHRWLQDRASLEGLLCDLHPTEEAEMAALRKAEVQCDEDAPLHTKTIPN
eukprot:s14464_g1.t1